MIGFLIALPFPSSLPFTSPRNDNYLEPASLKHRPCRARGRSKHPPRHSSTRARDLFGAAPVEVGALSISLLSGGGIWRPPTSTTSQNATG